jgi:steroid delta-isomerase-like uncharacterized protein
MSIESTRNTMLKYWDTDGVTPEVMAEDVVYTILATGEELHGLEGIKQGLQNFYRNAFQAEAVERYRMFGENSAMFEAELVGKHTGEFAGIPATGKDVRIPYCVIYDLENDKIKRARVYFELPVLLKQLGVQAEAAEKI